MPDLPIDYSVLIDKAMRGVLREVLLAAQKDGLPGEHHFYVSFNTSFAGVKISEALKAKYPEEMTIVLQHQFWDFKVEAEHFEVTLSFNGVPEKLVIPFEAVTAFADPSVKFGLQFQHLDGELMGFEDEQLDLMTDETAKPQKDSNPAQIISLDSFRKKSNDQA